LRLNILIAHHWIRAAFTSRRVGKPSKKENTQQDYDEGKDEKVKIFPSTPGREKGRLSKIWGGGGGAKLQIIRLYTARNGTPGV